ncbi:MAG: hypothetical protein KBS69_06885 [Bacteroidales bacterium]|nr:hypothetical protein [Candidatus Colicola caccequi]
MKTKFKFLATMLIGILLSVNVWGETVTSTFTDKNWNVGVGEEAWSASGATATAFESASPSRGVQTTLANIKNDGLTLTNTSIQELGAISKVEIVYSSNRDGDTDGTIAVAVGSTAFGDAFTIKKENNATISFENATAVEGDIVITFTSTASSKSVYVKSITVTYEGTGGDCTERTITFAGSPTTVEKTTADAPFQYVASIDVADGQTIAYSSSNTGVATVADNGTVTIVGAGETTITASVLATSDYCRASASYTVQVTKVDFVCWDDGITLDFTSIDFKDWTSSYDAHTVDFGDNLQVIFSAASKQGSTITDCPVSKKGYIDIDTKGDATMSAIHLVCRQWSSKAQTLTMKYCTDDTRLLYTAFVPPITSEDFEIECTNLPTGTTGVEIEFGQDGNQIGIVSACVTLDGACTQPSPTLSLNADLTTITTAESATLSTTGGNGGTVIYTITSDNAATGHIEGSTFTATALGQYTVRASQEATGDYCAQSSSIQIEVVAAKHTVNWYIAGVNTPTQVAEGAAVVFPSNPETPAGCEGKSFYGWAKSAIDGEAEDDAPTVYTSETMGTEDINFYAVFADKGGTDEYAWRKVTDLSGITAGKYVIKNGGYVLPNATVSSGAPVATTAPTVTDGVMTGTVANSIQWNFIATETANQFTIQSVADNDNYLYAIKDNKGVRITNNATDFKDDAWTFAVHTENEDGFCMQSKNNSRFCAVRYVSPTYDWASYTTKDYINTSSSPASGYTTNSGKLELYKYSGGATYSNYVTNCATYTVTWRSNDYQIRVDADKAPGTVLTAPTVDDVRDVNTKAACNDHLVGWVPAASTNNPKVKQDTAPAEMVGQQVTVTDNVVYHAVYADVAGE